MKNLSNVNKKVVNKLLRGEKKTFCFSQRFSRWSFFLFRWRKDKLKQHAAKHSAAGGMFQCRICVKTFVRPEHLRDHDIVRHSHEFPFRFGTNSFAFRFTMFEGFFFIVLVVNIVAKVFFIKVNCTLIINNVIPPNIKRIHWQSTREKQTNFNVVFFHIFSPVHREKSSIFHFSKDI